MPSLSQLPEDQLQTARDATDSVFKFRAYLPGNLLVMLLGRWREDVSDALGVPRGELPSRGKDRHPLDQLTSTEFAALTGAVGILTDVRYTNTMDDPDLPKLLGEFAAALVEQKTERENDQASLAS
jgi:hypothetical protein